MIYTITLNPALDYIMDVPDLTDFSKKNGRIFRSSDERLSCGGKGINVSVVMTRLGTDNTALGFVAGKIGEMLCLNLSTYGVKSDFFRLSSGETRINVKLKGDTPIEINAAGPAVSENDAKLFLEQLPFKCGDYVVLAGTPPKSPKGKIYKEIMQAAENKKAEVILDTSGEALKNNICLKPFLIKPNADEVAEIVGFKPSTHNEAVKAALKLQGNGARNILISLGALGAVLLTENGKIYKQSAPQGTVINTVGSGDALVAGFLTGYIKHGDYKEALMLGIASGSACAFSPQYAKSDEIMALYAEMSKE